jgi:hypothetical protein
MGNKSKKVNLKPFNPNKLKMYKSNEFEEAYTVELKLDSTPDDIWEQIFNNEYKASLFMMKRTVSVSGNKLRVVTSTHDNLKDEMEWVKELVSATNQRREQYNREVEQREKQKRAKEEENKRKIRDKLK